MKPSLAPILLAAGVLCIAGESNVSGIIGLALLIAAPVVQWLTSSKI